MAANVLVVLEQFEDVWNGSMQEQFHRHFLCDLTPVSLESRITNCFNQERVFCCEKWQVFCRKYDGALSIQYILICFTRKRKLRLFLISYKIILYCTPKAVTFSHEMETRKMQHNAYFVVQHVGSLGSIS